MTRAILKIAFLVWVILWGLFFVRGIVAKKVYRDYAILLSRPLDGKRSFVTGDRFYEFLTFCKKNMPEGSTYILAIAKEDFDWSIYKRRANYYLYPDTENDAGKFILVYDDTAAGRPGYGIFAKLDDKRYILKRN